MPLSDGNLEWADRHHVSNGGKYTHGELGKLFGHSSQEMRGRLRRYRTRMAKNPSQPHPDPVPPDNLPPDYYEPLRVDEQTNTMVIERTTEGIKTLEDLLEAANVDLSVWRVQRWVINKWPVGARDRHVDLTYTDGRMDGTLKEQGLAVTQLWQVKAWLVRIEPVTLFPHIQPITATVTFEKSEPRERQGMQRSLVIVDTHIGLLRDLRTGAMVPIHDYRVMSLILQVAEACRPDRIDVLGDLLDLSEWTDKFLRTPEFAQTTQPALLVAHWFLAQLRALCPDAKISLHQGNHEYRMEKMLLTHLKAAYGLKPVDEMELPPAMSVPRLLALHSLGVEWVGDYPDDIYWLNERLLVRHGEAFGQNAAKRIAEQTDSVEVFGHGHTRQRYARTMQLRDGPRVVEGYCPGCACHVDGRVPGHRRDQSWQQGFAVVDYNVEGWMCHVDTVAVEEGQAIWDGRIYEADDLLARLKADLPGWHWGN